MLFRPSDTFHIEFHVQHGHSHDDDSIDESQKFHAARTLDM